MPFSRATSSTFTLSPTELPAGAKPFNRRVVRGKAADIHVEHLAPNIWPRHGHAGWQILITFPPAVCDVTWWTGAGKKHVRRLKAGDVWILPPRWEHTLRWREFADAIVLFLDPEAVSLLPRALKPRSHIVSLEKYVSITKQIGDLCLELRGFAREPNGRSDWRVAGAGTHLAAVLLEAHGSYEHQSFQSSAGLSARMLEEVRRYVDERKGERVAVSEIAAIVGVSDRHLRRLFRRLIGKSPQEWVIAEKAGRAKALLMAGHTPKETVDAAGFHDTRHLRRVFRMCFGVTPKAFLPTAAAGPHRP